MTLLSQLRAAVERATKGPWDWFTSLEQSEIDGGTLHIQDTRAHSIRFLFSLGNNQGFAHTVGLNPEEDTANARLIVLLRNHAPLLIALADAARAWCAQDGDTDDNRQRVADAVATLTKEG